MGAVCKICGKDMMEAKAAVSLRPTLAARYTTASRLVPLETLTREGRKPPDATIVMHCSVTFTIGDATRNAVQHAVVS